MSRPPRMPIREGSPARSILSGTSGYSSASEQRVRSGFSQEIQNILGSFESAPRFSQLDKTPGRGNNVLAQTIGMLSHIWAQRDPSKPELCFDKHEGRPGTTIYNPPRRKSGGLVVPCSLATYQECDGVERTVNIINNNITMSSLAQSSAFVDGQGMVRNPPKKRPVQITFRASRDRVGSKKSFERPRNRGRFEKKSVVSIEKTRPIAPTIPLNTRGLRRLMRQWVLGDKERGLLIPLAEFDVQKRNGKDATGKSNKFIYSKRRRLAVAVLLALQDAFESSISFSSAIGASKEAQNISLSEWDSIAVKYLKGKRRLTEMEVIDLGKKLYHCGAFSLLPDGDE